MGKPDLGTLNVARALVTFTHTHGPNAILGAGKGPRWDQKDDI